jgi:hypothetical protein
MSAPVRILAWRPLRKGSLLGFAAVQFSSGLQINEIGVFRSGSRRWANPPGLPWIKDGAVVRDLLGKIKYSPAITFFNHGVQSSWSRQVIAAMEAEHPEAFSDEEEAVA